MVLISLSGKKRVGKDTIADYNIFDNFVKLAFADSLKFICSNAFNLDYIYFNKLKDSLFDKPLIITETHISELIKSVSIFLEHNEHISKDIISCISIDLLNIKSFNSPREILQYIGTNIIRKYISNTFFIDIISRTIKNNINNNNIIITDARFPDERDLIKSLGGKILLIKRNQIENNENSLHSSENSLGLDEEYDHVVYNDGSIQDLYKKIDQVINSSM